MRSERGSGRYRGRGKNRDDKDGDTDARDRGGDNKDRTRVDGHRARVKIISGEDKVMRIMVMGIRLRGAHEGCG